MIFLSILFGSTKILDPKCSISGQSAPDWNICLLPQFWRSRGNEPWQDHFVTMAKIVVGKVVHAYVPILPAEYRSNPTLWPRGVVGISSTLFNFFDFQPSKLKL